MGVTTSTDTVNIRTGATSHMTKPDTMAAIMDHTTARTVDIIITGQTTTITMAIIITMLGAGTQRRASAMGATVPTAVKKMIVITVWAVIWAISGCTNVFATCNANGH